MTRKLLILLAVFALFAAACGDDDSGTTTTTGAAATTTTAAPTTATTTAAPATTTTTEAPAPDMGTEENPIRVLFVPSVDAQVITAGGEIMAAALNEATGLEYEVAVPTSYAATAEEMCASPDNTVGFIPALLYVLATDLCGVDVSFKAVRRGWPVYWTQVLVARDSEIQTVADLDGLKWAYGDAGSTSGFAVPSSMWGEAGITPGDTVETGSHNASGLAVYNGEADFATTFFSPYVAPEGEEWTPGDDPDIPAELISECEVTAAGDPRGEDELWCGDYRVTDLRASLRTEAPDIVEKVRILTLSPPIPNDTLSFGSAFPADLRTTLEEAILAFSLTDAWAESVGHPDFYDWTGIAPGLDSDYDVIRAAMDL